MSPDPFDVRVEWGPEGAARLAATSDAVVVVDVLSFSTTVSVAADRGAIVYPWRFADATAADFARANAATLAGPRGAGRLSLSPGSFRALAAGARVVLPSPNGSTVSLATGATPTYAGCLRNARAVAAAASKHGARIGIVAAGERWRDGTLRPAIEDFVGAGAVAARLAGSRSPDAQAAVAAFDAVSDPHEFLRECETGRELREGGWDEDVAIAAEVDESAVAPRLVDGAYRATAR